MEFGAVISYLLSLVFISLGLHKMFVYKNPSSALLSSKNVYVGGDAYNYIINANYATGYFTLAIFCAVIGATFLICSFLKKNVASGGDLVKRSNDRRQLDESIPGI